MGTLSVRENIAFSAALRLPMSITKKERSDKVESVISELGLSHVANTMVRKFINTMLIAVNTYIHLSIKACAVKQGLAVFIVQY